MLTAAAAPPVYGTITQASSDRLQVSGAGWSDDYFGYGFTASNGTVTGGVLTDAASTEGPRTAPHADEGSESQRPAERADNHAQITRVADHTIHAAGHEHVPALDGDKPAETAAKDEHRPEAQHAAGSE